MNNLKPSNVETRIFERTIIQQFTLGVRIGIDDIKADFFYRHSLASGMDNYDPQSWQEEARDLGITDADYADYAAVQQMRCAAEPIPF